MFYYCCLYVVVNIILGNFCFPLSLGMVMYANEVETKEKEKLPEILVSTYLKRAGC